MLAVSACSGKTTGATKIREVSVTLNATASCDAGETCTWYWQYWQANLPRYDSGLGPQYGGTTPVQGPVTGPASDRDLSTTITGLAPNTTYRWVFCGSPNDGQTYGCTGPNGTFGSTSADPPPDYATFTTRPQRTLVDAWNGTSWTRQPSPNPSGAGVGLSSVSCTSSTACMAVGNSGLIERWDGTSWTIQPAPGVGNLSGVSCTSSTACTAVGTTGSAPLAEQWNGTSWTIEPTPTPSGVADSYLSSVSCTSATACTAVGSTNADGSALVEVWNGTSWTIEPSAAPSGVVRGISLSGVSCTSTTACTAVGSGHVEMYTYYTVAERWDGTSWTIQSTPNRGATVNELLSVSCTSAAACTAAGYSLSISGQPFPTQTLVEAWDGTTWTIQTTPSPGTVSSLAGVSCTSSTACTAVGSSGSPQSATLAERWDGTSWTVQPTPNPAGALERALNGVSCTSNTACTAVGIR